MEIAFVIAVVLLCVFFLLWLRCRSYEKEAAADMRRAEQAIVDAEADVLAKEAEIKTISAINTDANRKNASLRAENDRLRQSIDKLHEVFTEVGAGSR